MAVTEDEFTSAVMKGIVSDESSLFHACASPQPAVKPFSSAEVPKEPE